MELIQCLIYFSDAILKFPKLSKPKPLRQRILLSAMNLPFTIIPLVLQKKIAWLV